MKHKLIATIFGLLLVPLLAHAQVTSNFWKVLSAVLQPSISTWQLYSPGDFRFDGEILPDGALCAMGDILKKAGVSDWDCVPDSGTTGKSKWATTTDVSIISPAGATGIIVGRATSTSATTTNLAITALTSELLKVDGTGVVREATAGADYEVPVTAGDGLTRTVNDFDCDTASGAVFGCLTAVDWTTFNDKLSFYDAWTHPSAGISATTSSLLVNSATSTITNLTNVNSTSTNATTTRLAISGITSSLLKTDALGVVRAAIAGTDYESSLTAGDGLTRTLNDFDCDTASGSVFGCLTAADWTTFNNKLSSSLTKGYFLVGSDAGVAQATSSIFVSSTGNVGIRDTTPSSLLTVGTGDAFRVGSDGQASTTSRVTAQKGFSVSGVDAYASVNNAPIYGIGYSDLAIDGAPYNATQMSGYYGLSFVTSSASGSAAPRMVVTQSGKVGIGTSTPGYELHVVQSDGSLADFAVNRYGGGGIWLAGDSGHGYVTSFKSGGNLYLRTGGGGKNIISLIDSTGYAGIGTSSPSRLLSVHGAGYISSNLFVGGNIVSTSTTASILPYASTTALTVSGTTYLGTLTGPLQAVNGTVSASSTLSVAYGGTGATTFTTNGILYGNTRGAIQATAAGTGGQILMAGGSGVPQWIATSTMPFMSSALTKGYFLVGSDAGVAQATSSIFVSSTGNVGVGTTNPTYKLDVAGDINLTGRVRVSGGQALYVPGGNFTGTMYLGDGGGSLSYSSGSDGRYNTAVGIGALYANTTGNYNTANGVNALYSNTTGYSNTANGMSALYSNTTGYANTANGVNALFSNTTGYFNTAEGYLAGRYIADGSTANQTSYNSLYIGANTRALADGDTNEVVIGYGAIGNGSNSVTLGNTSISKTILQGNVGIGDTTPSSLLTVGTGDAFRVGSDGQASTTSRVTAQKGFSVSGVDAYASVNNAPIYGIGYSDLAIDGAAYNATQMSGYYGLSFVTGSVSGSAVPRMVVTQSGKVGIGTTTPLMNLDVYAASSTGYIARIFNSNTGNTSKGLLIQLGQTGYGQTGNVYVGFATSTAAGAPSLAGKITGNGSGITLYTGNADFAEYFRVSNPSEKPKRGELVSAAEGEAETVSRAMPGSVPLGIVSTSPGFIGNSPMCKPSDLNCEENIERYNVVVAMAGRVPTKVNMDGGAIKPGDRITLSTMPGVGAKATTSGVVVGIALDTFDADSEKDGDGVGMIKVLINLSYYKIDPEIKAGEVLANLWTLNESTGSIRAMGPVDFDNYPILNVKAIQSFSGKWSIDEDGSIVAEDLKVKGSATLGSPENRIGVTLYDEVSGAPYCLRISNGSVKTSPGECGNTSSDTSSGSSDDGQSTPPPSDTSTPPAEEGTGTGITPPSDATEETSPVTDPEPGSPSDEPTPEPAPTPDPVSEPTPESAPTPDPVSEPTPEVTPIPESAPGETTTP